jgi:hypothetical protein
MPFITDQPAEPGYRVPEGVAQPVVTPESPIIGPAFRQDNPVVNLYQMLNREAFPPEPDHNPMDVIRGTQYEQHHLDNFLPSQSEAQTRSIMRRVDEETADKKALDDAGAAGVVAQLMAGIIDPTILLPAGTIYRGARGAYSVARSAGSVGVASGLQAGVSELALQAAQETRTAGQSTAAIASSVLLGGLIGAGAAGLLSRGERQALETALDSERAATDAHLAGTSIGSAQPVGAAAADARQLDMFKTGLEFSNRISPTRRTLASTELEGRRVMADLAETPYRFKENEEGVATTQGPAVDRMVRMEQNAVRVQVADEFDRLFAEYRFGSADVSMPRMRAQFERLTGANEGKMQLTEFKQEVAKALREGDQHSIPQVAQAAQYIRNRVFEPWKERAIKAGLLPEDVGVEGAESYFTRVYSKEMIRAKRPEFVNKVVDYLKSDQDTKAAVKQRVDLYAAQLKSWDAEVSKFEQRLESLQARGDQLGARLDERAMEVRRTEKRTDTLVDRAAPIAEEMREIRSFIAEMRAEMRDPSMVARLDAMEAEANQLQRMDRPVTEADLRRVEDEELKSILTGETRMAAEILVGRRKPPKPPSLVSWILKQGGIKGDGPGAMEALQSVDRGTWHGKRLINNEKGLTLEELSERLVSEFPEAKGIGELDANRGVPTIGQMLEWIDESARGRPPAFMVDTPARRAAEQAAVLDEIFTRAGVEVKNIRDVAKVLRGEGEGVTLADLDRIAADLESAGESIPLSLRRAELEEKIDVSRETIAGVRQRLAEASDALASRQARMQRAEAGGAEALFAARQNRGRLGELQDRMDRMEARRELLIDAATMAARMRDEVRGKIENEIAGWQGKSVSEAKAALKAREQYAKETGRGADEPRLRSADSDIDTAVRRILDSERDLPIEELRSRAHEITDRILGSPDGRLPYDAPKGGPRIGFDGGSGARGPLAARQFAIPDNMIAEFLDNDAERVVATYLRTVVPDVALTERFGDVDMTDAMRRVNESYAKRIDTTKSEKDRVALGKERDAVIRDIAGVRDRIRGVYGWAPELQNMARVAAAAKNLNNLQSMGMAGAVFRFGLTNTLRDGWAPFFSNLSKPSDEWLKFKGQMRAIGIGVDVATNARQHAFDDMMDVYQPQSRFERTLQNVTDKFFIANMLAPLTDAQKTIAAHVAVSEILRASRAVADGKASKRVIGNLAESGIDAQMATRIAEQFRGGGEVIDGVHLPNTAQWTDRAAADALNGAVAREVDIAVITPGQEKPLWMSHPVLSLLGQFKSFTAAATERILIANLQRRDANALSGVVASIGLGMLSYKINSLLGGQKTSDRPQDWIKEGINKGGLLGWFEEGNALASKMTRGGVDMYRMIGADKPLSRYANRSTLDMFLGPTAGKIQALSQATGAAASGEWTESDTKAVRKLTAFQNLFWLRNALNEVEKGVNGAFGIPMREAR